MENTENTATINLTSGRDVTVTGAVNLLTSAQCQRIDYLDSLLAVSEVHVYERTGGMIGVAAVTLGAGEARVVAEVSRIGTLDEETAELLAANVLLEAGRNTTRNYDPARFAAMYLEDGTPRADAPNAELDRHDHTREALEALARRRRINTGGELEELIRRSEDASLIAYRRVTTDAGDKRYIVAFRRGERYVTAVADLNAGVTNLEVIKPARGSRMDNRTIAGALEARLEAVR